MDGGGGGGCGGLGQFPFSSISFGLMSQDIYRVLNESNPARNGSKNIKVGLKQGKGLWLNKKKTREYIFV